MRKIYCCANRSASGFFYFLMRWGSPSPGDTATLPAQTLL
jgi:hypothetical protein